ncbi:MAG TPA: energy transducer TonB [Candidatus Binatia bacterium]|nr:energy transducer TonB [Candidatus Binatia bacterium]
MSSVSASQQTLFSLLPPARTPWTEFVFSAGMQALVIGLLIWIKLLYPSIVSAPEHTFRSVQLVDHPAPVNHDPQPKVRLKPVLTAQLDPPVDALRLPAPQAKIPVRAEVSPAPTVSIAPKKMEPLPINEAPVIPKQGVKTNVFSTGSSATPTTARPASQVQTGGFGDPNGIPAKGTPGKAVNIAAAGSFDLPAGPGYGNGTGGAKGVPGVVVSSGFGNSTATPVSRTRASANVQQGGFGDADVAAAPTVHSRPAEAVVRALPAEILSKPTPNYTQEARSLRIEGEVLLEVVLEASGSLHVVRVVRGLGHGLDDNAVKAAEQIRFKPATKDGQPTDSTVVLHIIFQLA